MKKCTLLLLLIITNANVVYSQIIAGNTSSGLTISNPAINFSVATIYGSSTKLVDLDCDSVADISVELFKGPTAIDGSNYAFLHVLNPLFKICADTVNMQPRHANYFNLADTIVCPTTANWYNDANIQLGNYGCMSCTGPFSVTNSYLGYKNTTTSQIGWIKLSFNLIDGGAGTLPITFSIPEILSPCVTTSVSVAATPTYTGSGVVTCGTFTYNYAIQRPTCFGSCNGSISISNLTGGTGPYTFVWNTTPSQTGLNANNLCSGTYSLNITDASGNTCTSVFTILNPIPITFSLTATNVSCYGGANGSACATNIMGGNSVYTYMWVPAGGTMPCTNNLAGGVYYFCVKDVNNCQVCSSVTVNQPSPIQVSETTTHASCVTCCDGNSQLQISGGMPAYSTNYSPSAPSCPGIYTYSITDVNGCNYMDSVLISYPIVTGLAKYNSEAMFDVFPNPSKGNFEIKNFNNEISSLKIKVVDIYGKCVFSSVSEMQNKKLLLNLNIADGIYFLHISETSSTKEFIKKIVILQ